MLRSLLLLTIALASVRSVDALTFTDVTAAAGVMYQQSQNPVLSNDPMLTAAQASGGAAAGDYDRDGWVDLVVSRLDAPPILFRNQGDGTFRDVTEAAGDLAERIPTGSNGLGWADFDNDGDLDLYVTRMEGDRFYLFINRGDGTFDEEGELRGAALASAVFHYGTSVAFGDYDRDGFVDIFAAEWRPNPFPPAPPLPTPSANRLLRNRGRSAPGFFEDVTDSARIAVDAIPGLATSPILGTPGYSPGFVDFDGDGCLDLTWVADWGHSRLFWSNCDGTFTDGTAAAGVGRERSGMGSTQDDFNGDGRIDWYTTSIFGRTDEIRFGVSNQLYMNNGDRTFANTSATAGVADGGFGWGTSGFDFDHDGDVDIVATNGFLAAGHPDELRWRADRTRLFRNRGDAVFDEVGAELGINDTLQGKGLLTFDFDRDGDLDVLICNHAGPPVLYRNDGGNQGSWLELELRGDGSGRDAFGATVTADPDSSDPNDQQTRWLLGNPNFLGQDEALLHFGFADRLQPLARVTIRWPSGKVQSLENVALNQRIAIDEPAWWFSDVTAAAGLGYQHGYLVPLVSPDGSFDETRHFAGGIAAGDYDNDGWVDIYAVRGDIGPNLLFRNRGDGTFEERAVAAGVAIAGQFGSGPIFADIDGDGWLDLLIGGVAGRQLEPPQDSRRVHVFRNRGDGTFEDVTNASAIGVTRDTYSAAFGDYDRDGDLDLALAHWASLLMPGQSSETVWRNDGDFHFTDVSNPTGVSAAMIGDQSFVFDYSFTPNFADIDFDGWPDLLIAADFGSSRVLRNQRDGTFADITDREVISDENGMGAAVGDYDGDGVLDWFVSSVWDPAGSTIENWSVSGNRLYRGRGDGSFEDVTDAAGVRVGYWGWAASWGDLDNDGDLDLTHTNGFGRSADYQPSAAFFLDPMRLFLANGDGSFVERSAERGLDDRGMGRGVVSFDYDRDGDLDLWIANNGQAPRLMRNDGGNREHYLDVRLRGLGANSEAIGARLQLKVAGKTQTRELRAGSNFESQDPAEAHFGVGAATSIEALTILWPDGAEQQLSDIAPDQRLVIEQVAPIPTVTDSPSPTATATPLPSPTPTLPPPCFGDCDADNIVTVDEILRAIAIALSTKPLDQCRAVDVDHDGAVTVDEIVTAVRLALEGC